MQEVHYRLFADKGFASHSQVPLRPWELPNLVSSPQSGDGKPTSGDAVQSVWRSQDGVPEGTLAPEQKRAAEWVECVLVHALQKAAEKKATDLERFWLQNGARALVALLCSEQASVQVRVYRGFRMSMFGV